MRLTVLSLKIKADDVGALLSIRQSDPIELEFERLAVVFQTCCW